MPDCQVHRKCQERNQEMPSQLVLCAFRPQQVSVYVGDHYGSPVPETKGDNCVRENKNSHTLSFMSLLVQRYKFRTLAFRRRHTHVREIRPSLVSQHFTIAILLERCGLRTACLAFLRKSHTHDKLGRGTFPACIYLSHERTFYAILSC